VRVVFSALFRFTISCPVLKLFAVKLEVVQNWSQFFMFLAPHFKGDEERRKKHQQRNIMACPHYRKGGHNYQRNYFISYILYKYMYRGLPYKAENQVSFSLTVLDYAKHLTTVK